MEDRPKMKLEFTTTDKVLEIIGFFSLVAIWGLTIVSYNKLPDIIPMHYNGAGEVDRYGEKSNILALPLIATILFAGLTILNKFPHIFNYLTSITKANAQRQYTNATRMIRFLKLVLVVIFLLIEYKTIQITNGRVDGLGTLFSPFVLATIFIPLIYFFVKSIKQ